MCTLFWTGDYCETDINECVENNPCAADRICINLQGSYLCGCQAGFFLVGDTCRATSEFRGSFAITRIGSSEAIFTRDLEDPTSDQYQRIAGDVIGVLDSIFADESSYIESRVVSMSSGSIRVQYVLVFTEDTNVTVDVVSNQMRASIAADGEIASSALYIRLSSLSVASNLCPADYCKNGGTCSPDPVTYENNCICESAFSGNRCEVEDDWSPLVIAMVTVAGILFLILVGLFISCCIFLGKRLEEKKEPKYAGDLEGRDSFLKVSQPVLPWRSSSPSTDEPPHHPRGSHVSTSFAVQSIRVDGGAGCYRHSGDVRNGQQSSTFIRPYIVTGKEAAEH
ncbi:63 kDa sperm flagellar membrane protein-like [Acanthaster planci]|uniref:63 kDa sperm flagellar membrane protein-like n=1 Tax=Acanthaster planci TaxID=133434 RepID=A0A8B8A067_ACAPL|nr:63 kDa sperm flagellar membrane protein-like [Acanthaster planci]